MIVHQFYDKGLAHASYAIVRDNKMIVIDPSRNPQPYYDFAQLHEADVVGVIETHPHADFVSAHLEIHQTTGATIYCSKLVGAGYPHQTFDDGDVIHLADIQLKAINTPGHSPDSICILLVDEDGKEVALFTGDTLFVGDVGRPDLREDAGNITAKKEELAAQLYHSLHNKLMHLPAHLTVYPAHGPGSLCGKTTSPDLQSTIGRELKENYALQIADKDEFVHVIIADQPFVPHYFGFDVDLNKKGAPGFKSGVEAVKLIETKDIQANVLIIDTRKKEAFRQGYLQGAINLQDGEKFETWLGSVVEPFEQFYLLADSAPALNTVIEKTAKIGYEANVKAGVIINNAAIVADNFELRDFKAGPDNYTVIDVRNRNEVSHGKIFAHALTIPLPELRKRLHEIPTGKPIMVHCAAGYRSAAATSIIAGKIKSVPVYDLSDAITQFA